MLGNHENRVDRFSRDQLIRRLELYIAGDKARALQIPWPDCEHDRAIGSICDLYKADAGFKARDHSRQEEQEVLRRLVSFLRTNKIYAWDKVSHCQEAWPFATAEEFHEALLSQQEIVPESLYSLKLRKKAINLLRRYLDGECDRSELTSNWPKEDVFCPILRYIDGICFTRLPRGGGISRIEGYQERRTMSGVLSRCHSFLASNASYRSGQIVKESIWWPIVFIVSCIFGLWSVARSISLLTYDRPDIETSYYVGIILLSVVVPWCIFLWSVWFLYDRRLDRRRWRLITKGRLRHWPFESEADLEAAQEQ